MPKKKRFLLLIPVLLLVGFLLLNRPVSFWKMTGTDRDALCSLSATAVTGGVSNGVPYHDSYQLEATPAEDERIMEFFDLMADCSYLPSPRNLLPWPTDSVSGDGGKSSDYTVHVAYTWGESGENFVTLSFLGARKVAVSLHDESGYLVYFPADQNLVDKLGEFLKEHGQVS